MSKGPRSTQAKRDWGSDESGTSIMHVDMDAFFAACEVARRPELQGKPVVIGGIHGRSVVCASTYEARAFGVHSALPMSVALRRCPQAVVIEPDFAFYSKISQQVMGYFAEITPLVEQASVDEAFLDVSGARLRAGEPTEIGRRLRQQVEHNLGVTCSIGIAKNKLLAKLASTHAKPDGMLLIPAQASVPFLRTLPVGALWGVGEKTAASLQRWGITTVAQLADMDVMSLQNVVGKVAGAHLHDLAWGKDPRPVSITREEKSISNETTFDTDIADMGFVEARLRELSDKVAGRLRAQHVAARTVSIKVRTSDFKTYSRSRTLSNPSDVAHDFYRHARELLAAVDLQGLAIRLIGVKGDNLVDREGLMEQVTLEEASQQPLDHRQAELAMDAVRERFGSGSIALGLG